MRSGRASEMTATLPSRRQLKCFGLKFCHGRCTPERVAAVSVSSEPISALALFAAEACEDLVHPAFVRLRHAREVAQALGRQPHEGRPPILRVGDAHHQALRHQPVDDAGDVAVGHHEEARDLRHGHAGLLPRQRRHDIEPRQRLAELGAQAPAQVHLDHAHGPQQAHPQPQLELTCGFRRRVPLHGHHTFSAVVSARSARRCSWSRPAR